MAADQTIQNPLNAKPNIFDVVKILFRVQATGSKIDKTNKILSKPSLKYGTNDSMFYSKKIFSMQWEIERQRKHINRKKDKTENIILPIRLVNFLRRMLWIIRSGEHFGWFNTFFFCKYFSGIKLNCVWCYVYVTLWTITGCQNLNPNIDGFQSMRSIFDEYFSEI